MQPLTKKRRDLRFDAVIAAGGSSGCIVLGAAVPDNEGAAVASARRDAMSGAQFNRIFFC